MSKDVENRKGKKINNPHDAFIGKILRSKPEAESLMKGVFPKELIDVVNLNNIKLLPDTYLNNVQKKYFSDIVYEATCKESITNLKIAFIFEHKSNIPPVNIKLQVLEYFLGTVKTQLEQKQSQPALPIVILLYHGTTPWKIEPLNRLFGEVPENLLKYIPDFEYIPVLFDEYGNEKVKKVFDSRKVRATVIVMRDIFKPVGFDGTFTEALSEIVPFAPEELIEFLKSLMLYIQSVSDKKYETAAEIIKEYSSQKHNNMTIIDEILLEGEKRGEKRGEIRGEKKGEKRGEKRGEIKGKIKDCLKMIELDFTDEKIQAITELPNDTILMLRELKMKYGNKTMEHIDIAEGTISEKK